MINMAEAISFKGTYCTIVPLSHEHHDALVESVKDGELWRLWYAFVPEPKKMKENIALRLKMHADGSMLPFTVNAWFLALT